MNGDSHALVAQARDAFQRRHRAAAAEFVHAFVELHPPPGPDWEVIGRLAASIGEVSVALAAHRHHAQMAPGDLSRQLDLGAALVRFGRFDEAITLGRRAVAQAPDVASAHHFLGETLAQSADSDAAIESLRRAIGISEASSRSWLALTTIKRFTAADQDLAQLRDIVARVDPRHALLRGALLYALGKALDDIGDDAAAFEAFAEGAALIVRERRYDRRADERLQKETTTTLARGYFERLVPSETLSDRPIFIVGMPRSGSTLVEQILTAHSEVAGGAELGAFRVAAMAMPDFLPASIEHFAGAEPQAWTRLGAAYLHLLEERFGARGRIVDKTLNHAKSLGVIAQALPNARFIWMQRHPMATAWSCFRTHFGVGINWSWSLPDLAFHSHLMERWHEHWTRQFPERILTVPYEELVVEPERWIPRVLAHAGLADQPRVRSFHANARAVQTASTAQVRRPLDRGAIDRWRVYEKHLAPFF